MGRLKQLRRPLWTVLAFAVLALVFASLALGDFKFKRWLRENTVWMQQGVQDGWEGFDRVYFVTMPTREAQVRRVSCQLGISDSAWILHAFDVQELSPFIYKNSSFATKDIIALLKRNNAIGAFGCYISHFAAINHCYNDQDVNTCVIFEDDIQIEELEYRNVISEFLEEIRNRDLDWDLLYLDFHREPAASLQDSQNVAIRIKGCLGGHAYVINKKGAAKLLQHFFPMREQFDLLLKKLVNEGELVAYGINGQKKIFSQDRSLRSNINGILRENAPKFE